MGTGAGERLIRRWQKPRLFPPLGWLVRESRREVVVGKMEERKCVKMWQMFVFIVLSKRAPEVHLSHPQYGM